MKKPNLANKETYHNIKKKIWNINLFVKIQFSSNSRAFDFYL